MIVAIYNPREKVKDNYDRFLKTDQAAITSIETKEAIKTISSRAHHDHIIREAL